MTIEQLEQLPNDCRELVEQDRDEDVHVDFDDWVDDDWVEDLR